MTTVPTNGPVQVWGDALLAVFGMTDELTRAAAAAALVLLLCWAAWWFTGRDLAQRRRQTLFPPERPRPRHTGLRRLIATRPPPELLLLPLGLLAAWPTHSLLVAVAGAGAVVPAIRLRRRRAAARLRERRRAAVVGLCAALAGELRTGATPHQAVEMVAGEHLPDPGSIGSLRLGPTASGAAVRVPARAGLLGLLGVDELALDCTVLVAAVRFGGEVPEAFRVLATLPGAEGAAGIAACWQVASSSGAGLAEGLDRVAEGLRAEHALKETVRAELAGPRSTVGLLAMLPLFGLGMGVALGADPLRMLLHTPAGLTCLALGAVLECAGLRWTARIARTAEVA